MQRVTVSLPDDLVAAARERVRAGDAPTMSAFVAAAVATRVDDGDLRALLSDLEAELGPIESEDRAWADALIDRLDR